MQIVNFKEYGSVAVLGENFENWVYVGRPNLHYGLPGHPLANPYIESLYGRENCILRFKVWIWNKIKARDEVVMDALKNLSADSVLVCWCAPKPCHAEIIEKAWRYCKQEGLI
jgi:hypothetical protein